LSASTLGDMLLTPPTEWEAFANEWIELGGENNKKRDEVDDLVVAVGSWGSRKDEEGGMMED
jgi:hypothetical protein